MQVIGDIKGKIYEDLVRYASKRCDAVMFVFSKVAFRDEQLLLLEITKNKVKEQLKESILKVREGDHWVFTGRSYYLPGDAIDATEIQFYKFDDTLTDFLLTNKNLYNWLNSNYPEDVAFFKDGYCWLYSVAYEDICDIYCTDEAEYDTLKEIGIEFYENKFEPTAKGQLYFEQY